MSTCKVCERSGLPIVFLFNGAVAHEPGFAPEGATALSSDLASIGRFELPGLKHAKYTLRSLRPYSFLHIYHESPPKVLKQRATRINAQRARQGLPADADAGHWEVFRILPGGALAPETDPGFDKPEPFACTLQGGTHILTAMTYRLPDAHEASTIWAAVSANLWDDKLRKQNKANAQVMEAISIPMALSGGAWPTLMRPDAAWLQSHVADFALPALAHGGVPATSPLANVHDQARALLDRMHVLSAQHDKTIDKGFFYVLPDAAGTAEALADLSFAKFKQGLTYQETQAHPLSAVNRIQQLKDAWLQAETAATQTEQQSRPLKTGDLLDSRGRPVLSASDTDIATRCAQSSAWINLGDMTYQQFMNERDVYQTVPGSARFLPYAYDIPRGGLVIAPVIDVAATRAENDTRKMDRLYDQKAMQNFLAKHESRMHTYARQVQQHDDDRAALLRTDAVARQFALHYNHAAPNKRGDQHLPGLVYMAECSKILIGSGSCSDQLLEVMKQLLEPSLTEEQGWALRGMVANQQALFAPAQGILDAANNWFLNGDGKLDKSYDTLKTLLTDDWSEGYFKARFGWLSGAGIGLSFGLQGFLAGASMSLAAKAMQPAAERGMAAAKSLGSEAAAAAIGKAAQWQAASAQQLQSAIDALESAEARLSQRILVWCQHPSTTGSIRRPSVRLSIAGRAPLSKVGRRCHLPFATR